MEQGDAVIRASGNHRIMIFRLNQQRQWEASGTGFLTDITPGSEAALCVHCEETGKEILHHRILKDTEYSRQNDTIIVFYDNEADMDLAISFQHAAECDTAWGQVQDAAAVAPVRSPPPMTSSIMLSADDLIDPGDGGGNNSGDAQLEELTISMPTLDNLDRVLEEIHNIPFSQRNDAATIFKSTGFLSTLFDSFDRAKDLDAFESLFRIFNIVKAMLFLNTIAVVELLTAIDTIHTTINILEFDPELSLNQDPLDVDYTRYRKALKSTRFRDVVPIGNDAIVQSIQRHYLITFIRDMVLLRYLNDGLTQTLNSLLFCNVASIMTPLSTDSAFLDRLFLKLDALPIDALSSTEDVLDLFRFVAELLSLAKNLPLRSELFGRVCQRGLLEHISAWLYSWQTDVGHQHHVAHRIAPVLADILNTIAMQDPQLLRGAMLATGARSKLMMAFIGIIINRNQAIDVGMQSQASELVMVLLHAESLQFCNQISFLESCLEPHLGSLLDCIRCARPSLERSVACAASLIIFLVREHAPSLVSALQRQHWETAALALLETRHNMQLMLHGIRMVRAACVHLLTPTAPDHHPRDGEVLIKACVDLLLFNGPHRYNLLNSAFFELLDYIRSSNIRYLISYLDEMELPRLSCVSSLSVIEEIHMKAAQNREADDTQPTMTSTDEAMTYTDMQREEHYFESTGTAVDSAVNDTDMIMDDVPAAPFIERKQFQAAEEPLDFISIVKKRKKARGGLRPAISIQSLVSYPIEDDDDERDDDQSSNNQRRKMRSTSLESSSSDGSASLQQQQQQQQLAQEL